MLPKQPKGGEMVLQTLNKKLRGGEASSLYCVWVRKEECAAAPLVCIWIDRRMSAFEGQFASGDAIEKTNSRSVETTEKSDCDCEFCSRKPR
jgi:hypothetical protein